MLKAKIAVLVSGGGTNLQALLDAQKSGVLKSGEIALVISSSAKAFALERAKRANVPSAVVMKNAPGGFEAGISALLEESGIDLVILAGFMYILNADFTDAWAGRIINIHPSLIPSFCGKGFYGLRVHEAALEYGVKITGATVHYVNSVTDGGEIILQRAVPVFLGDTPEILQRRVMERGEWKILPRAAELVSRKIIRGRAGK